MKTTFDASTRPSADAALDETIRKGNTYSFSNFIPGESNQVALSAALAVTESSDTRFNPLFIYGPTGTGKTHLLCAIENQLREFYPGKLVVRLNAESFLVDNINHLVDGRGKSVFRSKYKESDYLLIDDFQWLERMSRNLEEFFLIFDHLYNLGHRIVVTSNRALSSLEFPEEYMVSRLASGFVVNVQQPNVEVRLCVLRQLAITNGYVISDEVLQFLASNSGDIRILKGALITLFETANFKGEPATLALAIKVLEAIISDSPL